MSGYRLSRKLLNRIREHASGSIYRMNATSADCYTFYLCGKGEWGGGWDWTSNPIQQGTSYLMMLNTGWVYKIVRDNNRNPIKLKPLKGWKIYTPCIGWGIV